MAVSSPSRDTCLQELEALRIEFSHEPYHARQRELRELMDEWLDHLNATIRRSSSLISSG